MEDFMELPNITNSVISNIKKSEESNVVKKVKAGFDTKNYLDTRINEENGETSKTITIRLLPMNLDSEDDSVRNSPFVKVHYHNTKVPQEVSKSGYKSYMCLGSKNKEIDHEKFGYECPFCKISKEAYLSFSKETNPVEKEMYKKIWIGHNSRESVIVRCIERGKESEGVKFWKFNLRIDQKDFYNEIMRINDLQAKKSIEKAKAKNGGVLPEGFEPENIFDLFNGRDITITFTSGQPVPPPSIMIDTDLSPLSDDVNQMKAWVFDTKKWQDVFTPKPYEYLNIISQGKVPFFDKQNGIWIDKEEYEAIVNGRKIESSNAIEEAEAAITGGTMVSVSKTVPSESMLINEEGLPW